ncbi:MAG: response regulator transcription factor [Burkholderiaceae bacterium]
MLDVTNEVNVIGSLKSKSQDVYDVEGFKEWLTKDVVKVLPFGMVACGYGRLHAGGVATDYILTANFPLVHFHEICNPSGGIETPLLRRWLKTEEAFFFDPRIHHDWPELSHQWMSAFKKNDLRTAVVNGMFDYESYVGTYFSFHRVPHRSLKSAVTTLSQLTLTLHETLCRVISSVERQEQLVRPPWELLSQRELEILTWVGRGRVNAEIAKMFFISESTVKHHISRMMLKLGMSNRVQLASAYMTHPPGVVTKGTKVL